MIKKPIHLVVPESNLDPGDEPVQTLFISPEGSDPDREVPGFFIIQINNEPVWPGDGSKPNNDSGDTPVMPRQFLSLDAAYQYLREKYGWKTPMKVTSYVKTQHNGARDFPAIWGADRKLNRNKTVPVRIRYLGSFRYWDGRLVDPTKVGTRAEKILS